MYGMELGYIASKGHSLEAQHNSTMQAVRTSWSNA